MIAEEARRDLERRAPDERVALPIRILRPTEDEVRRSVDAEPTRRGRRDALVRMYSGPKRRLMAALSCVPGVEIVDHEVLPHLVVTAPAGTWCALVAPGSALEADPDVEVAPNPEVSAY
jgi:hypothetical protein